MNWSYLRLAPWLDTRARFVAGAPPAGTLLDLGSSDGETLGHIAELRPDLRLFAVDVAGKPERYPRGCAFARLDLERERLPWPDASMNAITCMHVVEHLGELTLLLGEISRLVAPGGRVYFETPHPKSLQLPPSHGAARVGFTWNFHDDPTHLRVVPVAELAERLRALGFAIRRCGISRNWLFAAAHPVFLCLPPSRKKYTARVHWLGWSAYLVAQRPEVRGQAGTQEPRKSSVQNEETGSQRPENRIFVVSL